MPRTTRRRAAGLLLALACAPAACSARAERPDPPAAYDVPARTARPGETAVRGATADSGELSFRVIGLTTGLTELAGSHAEMAPRGRFARVRIVVANTGRTGQTFDARDQRLVTADGTVHGRDQEADLVKRQPDGELEIGAGVRVELDLWYDIPVGARPAALRVVGGAPLGAPTGKAPPADIKLP
ncbi:DUF4352 domain-containing protein [Actinomadura atramentaria]|uniref:DUF4352 domain-containing protein n=1 Tax=Actinomadura atramentaria TaxID=1990 RepID=UPI00037C21D1|nr:DUF4352 domain-containing protein [Actinomadura atramentaria]